MRTILVWLALAVFVLATLWTAFARIVSVLVLFVMAAPAILVVILLDVITGFDGYMTQLVFAVMQGDKDAAIRIVKQLKEDPA